VAMDSARARARSEHMMNTRTAVQT